jgi:hypothetical protein
LQQRENYFTETTFLHKQELKKDYSLIFLLLQAKSEVLYKKLVKI